MDSRERKKREKYDQFVWIHMDFIRIYAYLASVFLSFWMRRNLPKIKIKKCISMWLNKVNNLNASVSKNINRTVVHSDSSWNSVSHCISILEKKCNGNTKWKEGTKGRHANSFKLEIHLIFANPKISLGHRSGYLCSLQQTCHFQDSFFLIHFIPFPFLSNFRWYTHESSQKKKWAQNPFKTRRWS